MTENAQNTKQQISDPLQELSNIVPKKNHKFFLQSLIIVALSFVWPVLIPFGVYKLSQISALSGKRKAFLILGLSFCILFIFGFLFNFMFLCVAAFLLAAFSPFLILVLTLRYNQILKFFSIRFLIGFILLLPALILPVTFALIPQSQWQIWTSEFSQMRQQLDPANNHILAKTIKNEVNSTEPKNRQLISPELKSALTRLKSSETTLGNSDAILNAIDKISIQTKLFASYNTGQRLLYFVFQDSGSNFFFLALLISFISLFSLEMGYEHAARLRVVIRYIMNKSHVFPQNLLVNLISAPFVKQALLTPKYMDNNLHAFSHETLESFIKNNRQQVKESFIRLHHLQSVFKWNRYIFHLNGSASPWNLTAFALPLIVALLAVIFLCGTLFILGSPNQVFELNSSALSLVLGVLCFLSFIVLVILSLQGLFAFFKKVSTIFAILIFIAITLTAAQFTFGVYAFLSIFGSVGLLDYVYNWRKITPIKS